MGSARYAADAIAHVGRSLPSHGADPPTAYSDDATLERARVTEPFGYLLKPFDERELRTTIALALYKHRTERQRRDFLAMLSHDIRNPLAVILSYSDIVSEEVQGGDLVQAGELLTRLRSTALSVHRLVTNYLDVCRIDAGSLTTRGAPFEVNAVLRQLLDQYRVEAERRDIALTATLDADLPLVAGDPIACDRVVTNLLYNALKFTPPAGRITIGSCARATDVVITVTDTGPGIPPGRLPQLFERFGGALPGRHDGGVGLGLFIVRVLTEAQGGRVEVESPAGGGTTFRIVLPAAAVAEA